MVEILSAADIVKSTRYKVDEKKYVCIDDVDYKQKRAPKSDFRKTLDDWGLLIGFSVVVIILIFLGIIK